MEVGGALVANLERGAVVAGEDDQGVVGQAGPIQRRHDPPHARIQARDHRRIGGIQRDGRVLLLELALEARDVFRRRLDFQVRLNVGQVEEEGAGAVAVDELDGLAAKNIGGEAAGRLLGLAAPQGLGEVLPGLARGQVAVSFVEAAVQRVDPVAAAAMPLADQRRGIAPVLQGAGDSHLGGRQVGAVGGHAVMDGVAAGQQAGARGRADRRGCVPAGVHRPLRRQPVEVGRPPGRPPGEADVVPAQIVTEDHDDVGRTIGRAWERMAQRRSAGRRPDSNDKLATVHAAFLPQKRVAGFRFQVRLSSDGCRLSASGSATADSRHPTLQNGLR